MSDTIQMVFDKTIAVERIVVPPMTPEQTFNFWKEDAARSMAKFILEHNLMHHQSRYDIAGDYTHEAFTCLVARPVRRLP